MNSGTVGQDTTNTTRNQDAATMAQNAAKAAAAAHAGIMSAEIQAEQVAQVQEDAPAIRIEPLSSQVPSSSAMPTQQSETDCDILVSDPQQTATCASVTGTDSANVGNKKPPTERDPEKGNAPHVIRSSLQSNAVVLAAEACGAPQVQTQIAPIAQSTAATPTPSFRSPQGILGPQGSPSQYPCSTQTPPCTTALQTRAPPNIPNTPFISYAEQSGLASHLIPSNPTSQPVVPTFHSEWAHLAPEETRPVREDLLSTKPCTDHTRLVTSIFNS